MDTSVERNEEGKTIAIIMVRESVCVCINPISSIDDEKTQVSSGSFLFISHKGVKR